MMLTGIYTGTAADTAVNIINLLMDTHYAEIVEVCLHTVVWTSGNSNLDMVVGREDQLLNLSCQLVGIYITLNTVCVSDTGHDVAGADGRVACVIGLHIHVTHLNINVLDIVLDVFVYFFDVLILDSRNV